MGVFEVVVVAVAVGMVRMLGVYLRSSFEVTRFLHHVFNKLTAAQAHASSNAFTRTRTVVLSCYDKLHYRLRSLPRLRSLLHLKVVVTIR